MNVTLKGEAKDAQSTRAGIYIRGPKLVNGKSYWLQDSGTNAIWFDKAKGNWNIGPKDDLGGSLAGIATTDKVVSPQEATTWQYSNNGWIKSDDILVYEPGTYVQ